MRERDRETERQRHRQTDRQTETETERSRQVLSWRKHFQMGENPFARCEKAIGIRKCFFPVPKNCLLKLFLDIVIVVDVVFVVFFFFWGGGGFPHDSNRESCHRNHDVNNQ